ncbi:MAG TPA: type IV pilin protein [Steroidobacteraceae bacterium]
MSWRVSPTRGITLAELLTVLVVMAVLAAVAVPMWRVHMLRVRREDGIAALIAVQAAQDRYFGRNARYATLEQLGLEAQSGRGFYDLELRDSDDGLSYLARIRATHASGQDDDSRCVEFTLDQNNRRRAVDRAGNDTSADCWR